MNFKKHSEIEGLHAFLGPSKYHWINYSNEKLEEAYRKYLAIKRGTDLHEFASGCIKLGIKLEDKKESLNMYVNDSIDFKMIPEQPLYFSRNVFGTADAISFGENLLRISDLKTGETAGSPKQLEIYAALFCLEYDVDPLKIDMDFRLYQYNDILFWKGNPETILAIMAKIVEFDEKIELISNSS